MKRNCSKCGSLYTPFKPHHVICFDCHLAGIREGINARANLGTPKKQPPQSLQPLRAGRRIQANAKQVNHATGESINDGM